MLSIIIPTLNEEKAIGKTIHAIIKQPEKHEMIIVDSGSKDKTIAYARPYTRIVKTSKGRAKQMNLGAAKAKGDILVFLHADTILPGNGLKEINKIARKKDYVGGGFYQAFDDKHWFLRLVAWKSNKRIKHRKLIFGDQAIFIKKKTFQQIGGFKKVSLMEDVELPKQIKKLGKMHIIESPVITSARKFRELGIVKTYLLMGMMRCLHFFKVDTKILSKLYTKQ